ncbi:hypothetical protein SAMN00120144_2317 [Hymenobacter roseosalivarius DSM 11622]|uniref:Uncharacterized protein n=1 Tax=Hymenobacter roseosalivarius DSM 11622 TaxID=645990 RepID=A0A1W1VKS0_9BACT|nr:hypothetical protein SAMN00120144_2317 [Hymenobacter roseosalivarius DSM 11622]
MHKKAPQTLGLGGFFVQSVTVVPLRYQYVHQLYKS